MDRRQRILAFSALLIALPLAPVLLNAATPVAILPPRCLGLAPTCPEILSEYLTSELSRSGNYQVIEKAQIEKVLSNLLKEQSDLYDQAQAVQFGKLLSAQLVLVTLASPSSAGVEVTARLVKVETGEVKGSVSFQSPRGNYLELARKVVQGLLQSSFQCSSRNEAHGPEQAFDQDESSYWEAAPGNFQGWLEVSYPQPMRFSHAEFHCPETLYGSGVPKHFSIEYFDGARWQTATESLGNMLQNWAGDFSPQTAAKWRIQIRDVIGRDQAIRISEFRLEMREERKDALH
jgi:hypothetical protein